MSVNSVENATVEKKLDKEKSFHNNVTLTNGNKGTISNSPVVVMTPATSFCSPRQFLNSAQNSISNLSLVNSKMRRTFHEPFSRTSSLLSSNSTLLSSPLPFALMTHVPPPCLINPPPPVSLMTTLATKTSKQRNNLEQRLIQIFGKSSSNNGFILFFYLFILVFFIDNASAESNSTVKKNFLDDISSNANTQQKKSLSKLQSTTTEAYCQKSNNQNLDLRQPLVSYPSKELNRQEIIKERVEKVLNI